MKAGTKRILAGAAAGGVFTGGSPIGIAAGAAGGYFAKGLLSAVLFGVGAALVAPMLTGMASNGMAGCAGCNGVGAYVSEPVAGYVSA